MILSILIFLVNDCFEAFAAVVEVCYVVLRRWHCISNAFGVELVGTVKG